MNKKQVLMMSDVELTYHKKDCAPAVQVYRGGDAVAAARATIPPNQINLREFAGVLMLNRNNYIVKRAIISVGGVNSTIVDLKILFMHVLLCGPHSGFIVYHNHPSGDVQPSKQDLALTKRIAESAAILDVTLLDHLIISDTSYFSFAEEGLL